MGVLRTTELHRYRDDDGVKFINQYRVGKELGSGTSSRVFAAVDADGNRRALKIFSRSRLKKQTQPCLLTPSPGLDRCQTEIQHLTTMSTGTDHHPNIITLYEVIDSPDNDKIVIVLEYADQGELLSWQPATNTYTCSWNSDEAQPPFILAENVARSGFRQLVEAVRYLHNQMSLCHRDIKPANILVKMTNGEPRLLLSDFGVAEHFSSAPLYSDTTGTYAFMPPEACDGSGYDGRQADIWAVGVTLYSMVTGALPYYSDNLMELFGRIQACVLEIPDSIADHPVADLLRSMLQKQVDLRPSLEDILAHPWLNS